MLFDSFGSIKFQNQAMSTKFYRVVVAVLLTICNLTGVQSYPVQFHFFVYPDLAATMASHHYQAMHQFFSVPGSPHLVKKHIGDFMKKAEGAVTVSSPQ